MQLNLLGESPVPNGFLYLPDFISLEEEKSLLKIISGQTFQTFEMHGVEAKRQIIHYGLTYDFLTRKVSTAAPIPDWLMGLKKRSEVVLKKEVVEVLVTHYPPSAGIGWHHDAPAFESLLGISLLGTCRWQMRKGKVRAWEKFELELQPRDAYVVQNESRWEWQHHIPPVKEDRYSLTFRTLV